MTTPTPESAAAERLRRAMQYGCYCGLPGQMEQDWHLLAELYLRELDPRPVDEAFTANMAVRMRGLNTYILRESPDYVEMTHLLDRWLIESRDSCNINVVTVGGFHTIMRLFNVEVKPT